MTLGKEVNWGILGTSFISEVMAKAIHTSETGQLIAVGSRSLASAQRFAHEFTIPKAYDDFQSLLDDRDIDVVYIGLPNHLHKEWIIRAARAGKHILCEKPLVLNAAEAREVMAVIEETQVFCMEALMYRCHPLTAQLCEIIQSGILGTIRLYTATYTANIAQVANPIAGGSIRNLGCYPISLIRLLARAEPVEIIATGRCDIKKQTDNQASALLKFADDAMAVVSTADDWEMSWQFDVYGTDGSLKVLTNPWLPDNENKYLIQSYTENNAKETTITADQPLYSYQIDVVNNQILNRSSNENLGISLTDSLGNLIVLETWLNQVKGEGVLWPNRRYCGV
ncbi:Gfo/Idh/MocA family protein [Legionella fallonii]|uniref:Uncharacterized protein n=1 Tax=Legionella fallonii LLAP-10 TaxID=1212491 RepID=A0A098G0I4_9GAMM|nr:Gfo/Idh/MocA family oxidoreductase [Legionella fallonii]CEG56022.1 conserved protein of unknown function [Legionella fallonii LLAP-10]